jgi:hypothetical protein
MAPKRPISDLLTLDEKALFIIAICLDSGLRRQEELNGKVDVGWYIKSMDEEMVHYDSDSIP